MSTYLSQELERFAEIFKALASPHRLAIFLRLVSHCPPGTTCAFDEEIRECVGDVGKDLGIARTTVSHHVKELRRAGLLKVEKRGRNIECRLGDETVRALIDLLSGHLKLKTHSADTPLRVGERK
jgi:ArsR family transcriptional regulator